MENKSKHLTKINIALFCIAMLPWVMGALTIIAKRNLPTTTVYTNQANTWSTGVQSMPANGSTPAGLKIVAAGSGGAPTTGAHTAGEFHHDSAGKVFFCTSAGTPGTWVEITNQATQGVYSNLSVYAYPNMDTNRVTCTADWLIVNNSSNVGKLLTNVSVVGNLSASVGANGPDQASLDTANAWRSVWVIYNPSTDVTAMLLSDDETTSTLDLPSGSTFFRRVGWVRNDGSSNLKFMQQTNDFVITERTVLLASGAATSAFDVDASAAAPPGVTVGYGEIIAKTTTGGDDDMLTTIFDKATGTTVITHYFRGDASSVQWYTQAPCFFSLNAQRVFRYSVAAANQRADLLFSSYLQPL